MSGTPPFPIRVRAPWERFSPRPVCLPGTEAGHPRISRFNGFVGYAHIADVEQVSEHWLERIGHFFEHDKDLEKGKRVKLDGWGGAKEAKQIIRQSIERCSATPEGEKPHF